eukprot:TRINITY_DN37925_c0_g1_i1.p1 TRINITY_DN37925_c0_g1~~TRINITY_DN37925_c0_g1_i1.p1  ORF type:complete len:261 (-),score=46.89 TRINITY_DN37925_c0_g1_i1:439-1221(-)
MQHGGAVGPRGLAGTVGVHLQILLYFNVWYDILVAIINLCVAWYKWRFIRGPAVVALLGSSLALALVLEPFRLYLGYTGNLFERVPELFLFTFFCFLPCMGALVALIVLPSILPDLEPAACSSIPGKACVLPLEKACWGVQVVFLFLELLLGSRALTRLIREQSARFFRSLEAAAAAESRAGRRGAGAGSGDETELAPLVGGRSGLGSGSLGSGTLSPRRRIHQGDASGDFGSSGEVPQLYGRPSSPQASWGAPRRPHAD